MSNADDDPSLPGLEDLGDINVDDEILSGISGELEGFDVVDELEEDELIEGDGDGDGHVTDRDQLNSTFKSPKTEIQAVPVQSTPTRTTKASTAAVPTKASPASKTPAVKTGTAVKATAPTTAKITTAQNAQKRVVKLAASATSTVKPGVTTPGKKGPLSAAIVKTTGNKTTVAAAKSAGAALAKTTAVQGAKTTVAKPTTSTATANKRPAPTTTGETVSQGSAKTPVITSTPVKGTTTKALTTAVKVAASATVAKAVPTKTVAKAAVSKTPMKAAASTTPAKVVASKTPAKAAASTTPAKVVASKTPAKAAASTTPAKAAKPITPAKAANPANTTAPTASAQIAFKTPAKTAPSTTSAQTAKATAGTIVKAASSSVATKIILAATSTTETVTTATPGKSVTPSTTKITVTTSSKTVTATAAASGSKLIRKTATPAVKMVTSGKVMQTTSSSTVKSRSASKSPVDKATLTTAVVLEKLGDGWASSSQSGAKDHKESVAMETSDSRSPAESSSDEEGAEISHDEDVNVSLQTSSSNDEQNPREKFKVSRTKKQTSSVLQKPKPTSTENSQSVGKAKTTSTISKKSASSTKTAVEAKPASSSKSQDGVQAKPKASGIIKAPASSLGKPAQTTASSKYASGAKSAVNVLDMYQPVKRNLETPPDEPIDEVKGRARKLRLEKQIINRAKTVRLNPVRPADMADKALTKYFLESHCFSARFMGHKGAAKRGHLELLYFTEEEAQNSLTDLNGLNLDNGRQVNAKILYSQKGEWDGSSDEWQRSSAEEAQKMPKLVAGFYTKVKEYDMSQLLETTCIQESRSVFVNNVPGDSREEMIKLLFPDCKSIQLPRDEEGKTLGYALLEWHSPEEAEEVVQASREFELRIGDSILSLNVIARKKRPKTDSEGKAPCSEGKAPCSEDQKTIDDAAKAPKRANDDTDGKIDEASSKKKGKFEASDEKPIVTEVKYQGTDIKQLFHTWCNKNLCVPHYTFKSWGPTNRLMFRCELRLSKFDYIGKGTCRTNKKDSQTKCAYDYVKFLIRQSLIESPAIIRCEEALVARGLVDVLDPSDDIEQEKPDGEEGTDVTADVSSTSEASRPKADTDSIRDGLSWRERREQRRRSRSRSKERRRSREKKITDPKQAKKSSQKKKNADFADQRQKDIQALKAEITKQLGDLQVGRVSDPDRLGELAQKLQSVQEEEENRTQEQEDNPSGDEDTEKDSGRESRSARNQRTNQRSGGQSGDTGRHRQTNWGKRDRGSRRTSSPPRRENDAKKRRQDDLRRRHSSGGKDKADNLLFLYKSTTYPPASSIQGGGLAPNRLPGMVGTLGYNQSMSNAPLFPLVQQPPDSTIPSGMMGIQPGYNQLMANAPLFPAVQQSQNSVIGGMMGTPGIRPGTVLPSAPHAMGRPIPVSSASQGQQFNTSTGLFPGSGPSISGFQDPNSLKADLIRRLKDLQEGRVSDDTRMLHELADSLLAVQRREEATGTRMWGHTGPTTPPSGRRNQGNNQASQSAEKLKPDHVAIRENLLLRLQSLGVHSGTLNHLVKGLRTVQQQEKQDPTAPISTKPAAAKKRARQLQNQIHQKLVQQSRQTLQINIRKRIQDEKQKIQEENKLMLEQKRKIMAEQWNSQRTLASVSKPPYGFGSNSQRLSESSQQPSPPRIPPNPREVEQQRQQQEIEHSQVAPQRRFEEIRPRGILKYRMGQQGEPKPDTNRSSQYGWSPNLSEQTSFSDDSRYDPIPPGVGPVTGLPTRSYADDQRIERDEDGFRLPPTMSRFSNLESSFPGGAVRRGEVRDRGADEARGGPRGMVSYPLPLMARTVKPILKTQGASIPFNYETTESVGRPRRNSGGSYRPSPFQDRPMGASGLVDYPPSP